MQREMKNDFKNYISQNQNIDGRKQRLQNKNKESQNTEDYYSRDSTSRRKQMADEVFNEIMSGKHKQESLPSKIGYGMLFLFYLLR